ncbi:MAG TPA: SdpI family protein [Chitinophagaceae bacterium]|nr:SdpI family protein [Chitinophagaceae bacterium]
MNKRINIAAFLLMAAPLLYLRIIYPSLPETIPAHFSLDGYPDRFGPRRQLWGLAALLTVVNFLVFLLLTNVYRIDPRPGAGANRERMNRIALAVVCFTSGVLFLVIRTSAAQAPHFSGRWLFMGIGLLFCVIGNYMYNLKPNYFAGLRLPWTLESASNWRQTHRLASYLWFAGGLLIALLAALLPFTPSLIAVGIIGILMSVIPVVYSFRLYRKEKGESGL